MKKNLLPPLFMRIVLLFVKGLFAIGLFAIGLFAKELFKKGYLINKRSDQ